MSNLYGSRIEIEIVRGGFILAYPVITTVNEQEQEDTVREVFITPRKLHQKLKEVIDAIGLVSDDK